MLGRSAVSRHAESESLPEHFHLPPYGGETYATGYVLALHTLRAVRYMFLDLALGSRTRENWQIGLKWHRKKWPLEVDFALT
jgi:hypothetical protein